MNKVDRERVFALLSIYEPSLSEAQKKALEAHYAYDLSFGEISKEESISRAAVNDNVKTAIAKMEELENKYHILENKEKLIEIANIEDVKQVKEELTKYLKEQYGI